MKMINSNEKKAIVFVLTPVWLYLLQTKFLTCKVANQKILRVNSPKTITISDYTPYRMSGIFILNLFISHTHILNAYTFLNIHSHTHTHSILDNSSSLHSTFVLFISVLYFKHVYISSP